VKLGRTELVTYDTIQYIYVLSDSKADEMASLI